MTKKQAYEVIEKQYGEYDGSFSKHILPLCDYVPIMLMDDFCSYWKKINTEWHSRISDEVLHLDEREILSSLTRLIILHHFIEDTYK